MQKAVVFAIIAAMLVQNSALSGTLNVFTSDASGFNTHSIWYDDGQEITVVDTQFTPSHAEKLLSEIDKKKQKGSAVTRIIVTHPNPDKFNALSVFHKKGIESISSLKTSQDLKGVDAYKRFFWIKIAKAFTDETYPKIEPIKTTYSGQKTVQLKSGESLTLVELKNPGVSTNQTVVRIDKTGDLVVGDLVHSRTHAWLEGGIVDGKPKPTLREWKDALDELKTLGKGKVYGGRGEFLPVHQAVDEQKAYLVKAEAVVNAYIKGLGEKAAELSDPSKQTPHFKAIQDELTKAYPNYAMPELIGYSVYGLVQQKMSK